MKNSAIIYDTIIIGGGASGLYAAAQSSRQNGLIIYKGKSLGAKLLMSGGGQCNLTHAGSIKDFPEHYGGNGKKIRNILYKHSNEAVISYFTQKGVPLIEREDRRIFPASLKASDVRSLLLKEANKNGFRFCNDSIECISRIDDKNAIIYKVSSSEAEYKCYKLIIATGGCSYPQTGSDGSMFSILEGVGIRLIPRKPALAPILVQGYPYADLAGISFKDVELQCGGRTVRGALLFTHKGFSGPVSLNCSHLISPGDEMLINYLPELTDLETDLKKIQPRNAKQTVSVIAELGGGIPRSFAERVAHRAQVLPDKKFSSLSGSELKKIIEFLTEDKFKAIETGNYKTAMVTAGGVDIEEINLKTMECKNHPGIYIIGEALDVNGDTGGYNLQFAFSSAFIAANTKKIIEK